MPINATPPTPEDYERTIAQYRQYALALEGKLDKVRQWSDNNLGGAQNAALLAILEGREG